MCPIVPQEGMVGMASFKKLATGWQFRISYKDGDKYRTKSGNGYPRMQIAADIDRSSEGLDKAGPLFGYYSKWAYHKTGNLA